MRIIKDNKTAWILGYESNVGRAVYEGLRSHAAYTSIHIFSKKKRIAELPAAVHEHIWTPRKGWVLPKSTTGHDLFICFDRGHFKQNVHYKLTHEMIRKLPEIFTTARRNAGLQQVMICSHHQVNENAFSEINRVRSLIEVMIRKLDFWAVHIFRPVLVVDDIVKDHRKRVLAKLISRRIGERTEGWIKKNRPIESNVLAKAMIDRAQQLEPGVFEYKNVWLQNYLAYLEDSK